MAFFLKLLKMKKHQTIKFLFIIIESFIIFLLFANIFGYIHLTKTQTAIVYIVNGISLFTILSIKKKNSKEIKR